MFDEPEAENSNTNGENKSGIGEIGWKIVFLRHVNTGADLNIEYIGLAEQSAPTSKGIFTLHTAHTPSSDRRHVKTPACRLR